MRLVLFVAGATSRTAQAIENIRAILPSFQEGAFALEIIDVFEEPDLALADRVFVTPTLLAPEVSRRLVGDLGEKSQLKHFLRTLGYQP